MPRIFAVLLCLSILLSSPVIALAQDATPEASPSEAPSPDVELELPEPLIGDLNGDSVVELDAFGDSITRGVGDFISVGEDVEFVGTPAGEAGYPLRIELLLGVPVSNLGIPGERLSTQGLVRFADSQPSRRPDVVVIAGGTNDAIDQVLTTDYQRSVQTIINIARATGSLPILAGIPEACCSDSGLNTFIRPYNEVLQTLAVVNEVPFADIQRAYTSTCGGSNRCFLLNQPEGIHPNEAGYDVSAEVVLATLLGIDIFAADGPALLAQALGIDPGSILTIADTAPVAPTS